jgi:hypothetical protein
MPKKLAFNEEKLVDERIALVEAVRLQPGV